MTDNERKSGSEPTPLERYLAKQKQAGGKDEPADRPTATQQGEPARATVTAPSPAQSESYQVLANAAATAEFWPRFGAYLVDLIIVSVFSGLIERSLALTFSFLPGSLLGILEKAVQVAVIFFYYGWFYSQKGATPGKMILGLEVVERGTGQRLTYGKAFLREFIGKFISSVLLLAGFIIAAFREDRLALHDLIFDTRVIQKNGSAQ